MIGESNPPAYNSLWKLRSDAWGSLDTLGERLAAAASERRSSERMVDEAGALFELLEPIEHYWAFPGARRLERARRLFSAGDFDQFAHMVAGLNRELATDSIAARAILPPARSTMNWTFGRSPASDGSRRLFPTSRC